MSRARRLLESLRAFALAFRNRELRRLQLAGIGSTLGTWAYLVALAVYAYHAGGARAVGLIAFVRWGLAAGVAPWLALLADRVSRRRVMLAADLTRVALAAGMAALAALDGPSLAVYALAVFVSIVSTAFPPAQAALLPSLARTPEELTSANVAMSTIASVGCPRRACDRRCGARRQRPVRGLRRHRRHVSLVGAVRAAGPERPPAEVEGAPRRCSTTCSRAFARSSPPRRFAS